MRTVSHSKFIKWLFKLDRGQRNIVEARLARIHREGILGGNRSLGDGLHELKWKSGWRVYFSYGLDSEGRLIILYWGGTKSGQKKDIQKARKLQRDY